MKLPRVSVYCIIGGLLLIATSLNAQEIQPPFNASEVIRKVNQNRNVTESREGEFLIDTSAVYCPAQHYQGISAVAFDGINYLVVWQDDRLNAWEFGDANLDDIYGTRVTQDGTVLDSAGIKISTAINGQRDPSVAFDGTNFLVVWMDERNDLWDFDIYGARVATDGTVLDTIGIAISTANGDQRWPSVTCDGNNYLVVWEDYRLGPRHIYGARIAPSGVVLDTAGIAISPAANDAGYPAVAGGDVNYLVAWVDYNTSGTGDDIYGARVATDGTVLDTMGIAISIEINNQFGPAVTFDGTNYFVAWEDWRIGLHGDIYGARVATSGVVLDTSGIAISVQESNKFWPSVSFNGTNYLIAWNESPSGEVRGARVSCDGTVLDSSSITIFAGSHSAVTSDSTYYFITGNTIGDVHGARVAADGTLIDSTSIAISIAVNSQYHSDVAFDGTNYMVVWGDCRDNPHQGIYCMRISQDGTPLDSTSVVITSSTFDQFHPAVASNGLNYLVVWSEYQIDSTDLYGARISLDGIVLDPNGFLISTVAWGHYRPEVSSDGTSYFAVWYDGRNGDFDIYGTRITTDGIVLDPNGIAISTAARSQSYPSLTFGVLDYFVVWHDRRNDTLDIYGARVTPGGIVLDTAGITISTAANYQYYPRVAFGGLPYFVVWVDGRNSERDIYGARVLPDGTVLDTMGITISTAAGIQDWPDVSFDGTNFFVAWQDGIPYNWDIYGASVNQSGIVIDSFDVALQPGMQIAPSLAHGNGNQILLTYSGWTDSVNTHPANCMRIWGEFFPIVGVGENACTILDAVHLLCVYPNPVHGTCNIKYSVPQKTRVNVSMYDVTGRLVKKLVNERQDVGIFQKTFELADLAQGVYFIRLNTKDSSETKKVVFIK